MNSTKTIKELAEELAYKYEIKDQEGIGTDCVFIDDVITAMQELTALISEHYVSKEEYEEEKKSNALLHKAMISAEKCGHDKAMEAIKEFAEKYKSFTTLDWNTASASGYVGLLYNDKELIADLTALINEHTQEMFEFVKWIGFNSTILYYRDIDEKWIMSNFDDIGVITEEFTEYTTEGLFNYWIKNIKQ